MKEETKRTKYQVYKLMLDMLAQTPANSINEACKLTGMSTSLIKNVCEFYNLDFDKIIVRAIRHRQHLERKFEELVQHVETSTSFREVARKMRISRQRVHQLMDDCGIRKSVKQYFAMKKRLKSISRFNEYSDLAKKFLESDSYNQLSRELDVECNKLRFILEQVLDNEQVETLSSYYKQKQDEKFRARML